MAQTHHYLFDTATGFNDSIGSTNLTPSASGSIGSIGKINQCLEWSSNTFGAATSSSVLFPPTGSAFSVAFWLKTTSSTMTNGEFIKNTSTGFVIETTDAPGYFQIRYSSMSFFPEVFSPASVFWNSFNHIVFTYDGSSGMGGTGTWNVYINGSLITTSTVAGTPQTSGFYMIGEGWDTTSSIDDLRIYDAAIDATEVAFIYNSGVGTQAVSSSGAGSASGSLATVTMSAPAGSATGSSGGSGSASGALSTITMSGPAGSATSGSSGAGTGSLPTITMSAPTGIAFPEFIGTGSLSTVLVVPIEAVASISTSIQLSYVACDAEIGWKQSLPITGFASAVQGEDAISARITPVVSGTEANIVFFEQRTLTASSSYTYDLQSLTDFLGQSFSLSRAYAISVVMTSGSATISPGAANPLKWFFNSNTANVTITSGNSFLFAQKASAIVSGSAKTILVTNPSGLSACVYKIAILGGR